MFIVGDIFFKVELPFKLIFRNDFAINHLSHTGYSKPFTENRILHLHFQ